MKKKKLKFLKNDSSNSSKNVKSTTTPARIFTGISFRSEPHPASLQKIKEICRYYERKCGGKVCPLTAASRHLFDMSRDIQAVASELIQQKDERVRVSEKASLLIKEWTRYFGPFNPYNRTGQTPETVSARLRQANESMQAMTTKTEELRRKLKEESDRLDITLDQHFQAARTQYADETARLTAQHRYQLEAERATTRGKIQALKELHQDEINALKNAHARANADMKDQHKKEIDVWVGETQSVREKQKELVTKGTCLQQELENANEASRVNTINLKTRERELLVRVMMAESRVKELESNSTNESALFAVLSECAKLREELQESRSETALAKERGDAARARAKELQLTNHLLQQSLQELQGIHQTSELVEAMESESSKPGRAAEEAAISVRVNWGGRTVDEGKSVLEEEEEEEGKNILGLSHMLEGQYGELQQAWRERNSKHKVRKVQKTQRRRNIDQVKRRGQGTFNPNMRRERRKRLNNRERIENVNPAFNVLPEPYARADEATSFDWRRTLRRRLD
eukprot:g2167.t1